MFGPVLRGEKVTLRPADDTDPPRFVAWLSDLDVSRYLGRRVGWALHQEVEFFKKAGEDKNSVLWVIEGDGETIGATGIHAIDWQNAHATTGIAIGRKEAWGRGYASEAMALRTRYAFRDLNLRKLMTEVFVDNVASRTALEKTGYRTVGTHREHFFSAGTWHDVWLGEVLRSDWEKTQGA